MAKKSEYSQRFMITLHVADAELLKAQAKEERKPMATLVRELAVAQLRQKTTAA